MGVCTFYQALNDKNDYNASVLNALSYSMNVNRLLTKQKPINVDFMFLIFQALYEENA